MYRVLKDNGAVIILENNNSSLHRYLIPRRIRDSMQPAFKKIHGESVHEQEGRAQEYSIEDYINIFSKTKFKLKSIRTFYFARIVSLVDKPLLIRFIAQSILSVFDILIKLFPKRGYWVVFVLKK